MPRSPGLSTLATLKPANKERQAHLILFRQDDEASNYHVAFEAALLLRPVEWTASRAHVVQNAAGEWKLARSGSWIQSIAGR